jgi:hypothetical protein
MVTLIVNATSPEKTAKMEWRHDGGVAAAHKYLGPDATVRGDRQVLGA